MTDPYKLTMVDRVNRGGGFQRLECRTFKINDNIFNPLLTVGPTGATGAQGAPPSGVTVTGQGVSIGIGAGLNGNGFVYGGNNCAPNATISAFNNALWGDSCAPGLTTASRNAIIGYSSALSLTTGTDNVAIGTFAGPASGALNNTISLGSGAQALASNTFALGSVGSALRVDAPGSPTGGTATALPAQPVGYLYVLLNGSSRYIPLYGA